MQCGYTIAALLLLNKERDNDLETKDGVKIGNRRSDLSFKFSFVTLPEGQKSGRLQQRFLHGLR